MRRNVAIRCFRSFFLVVWWPVGAKSLLFSETGGLSAQKVYFSLKLVARRRKKFTFL